MSLVKSLIISVKTLRPEVEDYWLEVSADVNTVSDLKSTVLDTNGFILSAEDIDLYFDGVVLRDETRVNSNVFRNRGKIEIKWKPGRKLVSTGIRAGNNCNSLSNSTLFIHLNTNTSETTQPTDEITDVLDISSEQTPGSGPPISITLRDNECINKSFNTDSNDMISAFSEEVPTEVSEVSPQLTTSSDSSITHIDQQTEKPIARTNHYCLRSQYLNKRPVANYWKLDSCDNDQCTDVSDTRVVVDKNTNKISPKHSNCLGFDNNKSKQFICNEHNCGKNFATKATLIRHKRLHSGEKPFVCEKCGKYFAFNFCLNSHTKSVHAREKQFVCHFENCGKRFALNYYLKSHVKSVHFGEKSFICDYRKCGKGFSKSSHLVTHKKTVHFGGKRFVCDVEGCDKKYSRIQHLDDHRYVKTMGETSFVCNYANCGEVFYLNRALNCHKRNVHLKHLKPVEKEKDSFVKMLECYYSYCNKLFATKCDLTAHVYRIHLQIQPGKCIYCLKIFATESQLNHHIKLKHKVLRV